MSSDLNPSTRLLDQNDDTLSGSWLPRAIVLEDHLRAILMLALNSQFSQDKERVLKSIEERCRVAIYGVVPE